MRKKFLVKSKPVKQEVSHRYSDTSPFGECSLLKVILLRPLERPPREKRHLGLGEEVGGLHRLVP